MKISLHDFLLSHKKTAGLQFVEKVFETNQFVESDDGGKTFYLTKTGGEVHQGEPLVMQLQPVETLQEKIARFERVERNMNLLRLHAYRSGALQMSDDDADDDYSFANDNSQDVDDFGDPFQDAEELSSAEAVKGDGQPSQPSMPAAGISPDEGVPAGDVAPSGMVEQENKDASVQK